ncbi:MAG: TonB-dependent receptor [Pseudomonadota bacterium]
MRKLLIIIALACGHQVALANDIEEIRVTVHPLSEEGIAQSSTVVSGEELAREVQGSLGETLSNEAGISSASFGTAVGRPVIHGLGGARVKTTEDKIDSLDVSVISGDHAVTIEPFIADQVTVLKGASTLLFGSNAIGGVVDVETGRIPNQIPEKAIGGRLELRGIDNGDATVAAVRLDGSLSENIAWHLDAFSRDADDYDIPGFVESAAQRAAEEEEEHEEEEHEEEEHEEEEEERDILEGSRSSSDGGAFGLSFVGDRGFAGFSVSTLNREYGLVGGHGHEEGHDEDEEHEGEEHEEEEHEEEEEGVGMIDMEQTRFDFEAQVNNPFAGFEYINFRLGINDYEHQEIEGSGEVGTFFDNDAWEGRVELRHEPIGGFDGVFGLQLNNREFSALGEEAFVIPVESDSVGVFWVGEKSFDNFDLETGVRLEEVDHSPIDGSLPDRDFTSFSASLGMVRNVSEDFAISGLLDITSRTPSIEELYSNGPHLATNAFEIGDPNLDEESAVALSFTSNYRTELINLNATLYFMTFDDYIFQAATGEEEDELPVFVWEQGDAEFTGLDASADVHLGTLAGGDVDMSVRFDIVNARLDGPVREDLPRIPADTLALGLSWKNLLWHARVNYKRVSAQNDVAEFELPTEEYDDLSVFLNRKIEVGNSELDLFFHGRNLTDDEQRNHASIVKDFAPAPGRRLEVGLRMKF